MASPTSHLKKNLTISKYNLLINQQSTDESRTLLSSPLWNLHRSIRLFGLLFRYFSEFALIWPYWVTGRKTPSYLVKGTDPLEPFQRQRWGNFWETGWSAYGLFRVHIYHLELNWTEVNLVNIYILLSLSQLAPFWSLSVTCLVGTWLRDIVKLFLLFFKLLKRAGCGRRLAQ